MEVPFRQIRQWKTLFLRDHPVTAKVDIDIDKDAVKAIEDVSKTEAVDVEMDEKIRALDEQEFSDYLTGTGDWTYHSEV